jgi:2-oxoglutarate dehydrogenase E2 component (dihydrolipoamide succinyltransferase)
MKDIIIPQLGESITEATIAKIKKKVGEGVNIDEVILELETDKITMEVTSDVKGVIKEIKYAEGATVAVGAVVAVIDTNGTVSQSDNQLKPQKEEIIKEASNEKILSPAASKIATEKKLDVNQINGSGKDGRITKGDVMGDGNNIITLTTDNAAREERVKMSKLRRTIAERLKDSQNTAAILTTFNEVDMSAIIDIRNKYKEVFEKKHGIKLGFMSFFVKAVINALKEIPSVNAEIRGDEIIYKNYYDMGVAVGTEQGLVVPIIRDANLKSFAMIEKEIGDYGKKAREGKLTMKELTGGTFTISNGGVYGSLLSTPIINPPQSGILGMHKTQERPVAINGKVEIRPMMYLALSYDHRIIDGKEAVTFLIRVKEAIEAPERLLFEI